MNAPWRGSVLLVMLTAIGCGGGDNLINDPGNGGGGGGGEDPPPVISDFPVVSTFDADAEGWGVTGDAQDGRGVPEYDDQGGNPGGRIYAIDDVLGTAWFFRAPAKFRGVATEAYGKYLKFDLKTSDTTQTGPKPDAVMLVGASTTLVINNPPTPTLEWTAFSFKLDETGGWVNRATGQPATKAEFDQVLADVREIYIRGEFREEDDAGSLDNVYFGSDS